MTLAIHSVGLIGHIAIALMLVFVGLLSRKLGSVTHTRPYYWMHILGALLILLGLAFRFHFITVALDTTQAQDMNLVYTLLCNGLPALGITIGLIATWHYWSWLLAERD